MKEIQLTQGCVAIVDEEDFHRVEHVVWHAHFRHGNIYARGRVNGRLIYMHRLLLNAGREYNVDHIDGNGLNNRRSNIRLCDDHQNQRNAKVRKDNTTGFKGVVRDRRTGKYRAQITINNIRIYLGMFSSPIEAARIYDNEAKKHFGEFAHTNFDV